MKICSSDISKLFDILSISSSRRTNISRRSPVLWNLTSVLLKLIYFSNQQLSVNEYMFDNVADDSGTPCQHTNRSEKHKTCAFFSLFYFHFPWLNIFHQPVTVIKLSQSTVNRGMPALTNQAEDIASCRLLARMSFPANSEWASKSASTCMVCVIVHISAYNSAEIMLSNSREWFRAGDLSLNGS